MSSQPATTPAAVFLSYAREDAEAARRIADALRAFGVEVWFDQHELRGGDQWDQKIRRQIKECALFVPIVSATTEGRHEGYFRREWKLAVERTHDMAASRAFLLPVVIDATPEAAAEVPEEFMRVQWTRLENGVPSPDFVAQVKRLLGREGRDASPRRPDVPSNAYHGRLGEASLPPRRKAARFIVVGAGSVLVAIGLALWLRRPGAVPQPPASAQAAPIPKPAGTSLASSVPVASDKSVAVLPFANLSAEKDNEYFADGVHEDVITSLAKIRDLKVISRTSVLAYRDPAARNLRKIAEELGVAAVLEGSVRRMGGKVRVTAQLIDARTDQHLWAENYDRDVNDIFAVQAAIAREIAGALKASLSSTEREQLAQRPTENQSAYDLFLRARALRDEALLRNTSRNSAASRDRNEQAIAAFERLVAVDPKFLLAYVELADLHGRIYWFGQDPSLARLAKIKSAVDAAVRVAPDRPETRMAVGWYHYQASLDFERALREFTLAERGLPNDAELVSRIGAAQRRLGRWQEANASLEKAVRLDPRDPGKAREYMLTLQLLRRFPQELEGANRYAQAFSSPWALNQASFIQFEIDGDFDALRARTKTLPTTQASAENDDAGRNYQIAWQNRDFAAADRILSESANPPVPGRSGGAFTDPVPLVRAFLAVLRGDPQGARVHAEAALSVLRAGEWSRRQAPWVKLATARAHAYAGRAEEARKEAQAGWRQISAIDQYDAINYRDLLAELYLVIGAREEALAELRAMMSGPSRRGPNAIRFDPVWARLKDEPRFEEILKSAKPL